MFSGNHGEALGGGLALRADLAAAVQLRRGFHAFDDRKVIRSGEAHLCSKEAGYPRGGEVP